MKGNTRKRLGLVARATVGLASLLGGTGCSMISEFNPAFRPNDISSTHKQRGLFEFGRKIEGLYISGVKWKLDNATDTLYVRADNFSEALDTFHIKNSGTYNELFEGARLEIAFHDPRSQKEVVETQIVANDGTIDSEYFGSFNAFTTRTKLDEAITAKAREKFGDATLEVAVRHVAYPFAEKSDTFLGYGAVNSYDGAVSIIPLLNQPLRAQFATMAGPTADTAYVALIKHATNGASVARDNPEFVNRVIVYGPTGNFVSGMYDDVNFADKDYLVGLGNRPWTNTRAFLSEFGGLFNDVSGASDSIRQAHDSVDQLGHAEDYLTNNQGPHESRMQQAVRKTGEVKSLLDNANGIKAGLNAAGGQ